MAPTPVLHPFQSRDEARRRSIAAHPAGRARRPVTSQPRPVAVARPRTPHETPSQLDGQTGSITTEYGLVVVVGATICSLVIKWASGGAVFELLGGVLQAAKGLVGF